MKEVFSNESGEDGIIAYKLEFPKLKKMILDRLPCLANFCKGFKNFVFPQLFLLNIKDTPKLKSSQFKKKRFTSKQLQSTRPKVRHHFLPEYVYHSICQVFSCFYYARSFGVSWFKNSNKDDLSSLESQFVNKTENVTLVITIQIFQLESKI